MTNTKLGRNKKQNRNTEHDGEAYKHVERERRLGDLEEEDVEEEGGEHVGMFLI